MRMLEITLLFTHLVKIFAKPTRLTRSMSNDCQRGVDDQWLQTIPQQSFFIFLGRHNPMMVAPCRPAKWCLMDILMVHSCPQIGCNSIATLRIQSLPTRVPLLPTLPFQSDCRRNSVTCQPLIRCKQRNMCLTRSRSLLLCYAYLSRRWHRRYRTMRRFSCAKNLQVDDKVMPYSCL